MAVVDIISQIFASSATFYTFQPAATVEILITEAGGSECFLGLNDGVTGSIQQISVATASSYSMKLGITNTNYLYIRGNGSNPHYSGIQIK